MERQTLRAILREASLFSHKLPMAMSGARTGACSKALDEPAIISGICRAVNAISQNTLQVTLPDDVTLAYLTEPLYYADVYEDNMMHACLFGFRMKGGIMPLHDHPLMHGFVKVIRGSVSITSYSWLTQEEEEMERKKNIIHSFYGRPVRYEGTIIRTSNDECAHLGPLHGNIHSMVALEAGTTFFDLLVPGYGERDCGYYEPYPEDPRQSPSGICFLKQVPPPRWYMCQDLPFDPVMQL